MSRVSGAIGFGGGGQVTDARRDTCVGQGLPGPSKMRTWFAVDAFARWGSSARDIWLHALTTSTSPSSTAMRRAEAWAAGPPGANPGHAGINLDVDARGDRAAQIASTHVQGHGHVDVGPDGRSEMEARKSTRERRRGNPGLVEAFGAA